MHIDFNQINGFQPLKECDCNNKLKVGLTFKLNQNGLSTYVIVHIDTIKNNIIFIKIIDSNGNFCLNDYKLKVYNIDLMLYILGLKFNHKYGDRIYFNKNKILNKENFFNESYVKNEIHGKLAMDFLKFVMDSPFKFKTSINTRYDYVDFKTFRMEKVEYIKYELIFNKNFQLFYKQSKLNKF